MPINLEEELLLCCARTHLDPQTVEQTKTLLEQNINWNYLIQASAAHGITPLLYWSLNSTYPKSVPKTILSHLRNIFHTNAQHNLFLTKELLKILNLFAIHDIPAIPYKGPVLAVVVYNNLAFRQFGDLDILVHKSDILKAKELLISEGYQPKLQITSRKLPISEEEQSKLQTVSKQELELLYGSSEFNYKFFKYSDSGIKLSLELHWSITGKGTFLQLDSEWWWDSVQPISLAGQKVLGFLPEDLLLILCIHGIKDHWIALKWLCDVAELLRNYQEIDWEFVMKQSKMLCTERVLFLGLLLANQLLGATLPDKVFQKIQADPVVKLYAAKVSKQLFSEIDSFYGVSENFLYRLMRDPLPEKVYKGYLIGQFLRLAITPTEEDRMFLSIPESFKFLYYLVRPVRLVSKHGLALFKRILVSTVVQ